jgi:LCP family protein required for cell wall assembly
MQRINLANIFGGPDLLKRSVSNLTRQEIDYYVKVKPTAVTKLVDLLGGVYLEVEEDMYYVDRVQDLKIDLKKGYQKLSGKEAHDYLRYRDKFRGDIGRIERQQKFFKALSRTLTSPANILKAPRAIRSALGEIETDLPLDLTIRILNMSRMVTTESVKTTLLPGEVSYIRGVGSVWLPDAAKLRGVIGDIF